jgi:hypothetical protein
MIEKRFADLIDAIYRGEDSLNIDVVIELGEGKSARVQSTVLFRNLG